MIDVNDLMKVKADKEHSCKACALNDDISLCMKTPCVGYIYVEKEKNTDYTRGFADGYRMGVKDQALAIVEILKEKL